jgi:DNA-dependent RNA polymerase auxiliary subunit epsilon
MILIIGGPMRVVIGIQEDRRVEVFLFPSELGVLPPVPGEKATGRGEKEYPEWRFRAVDFDLLTEADFEYRVRLHDDSRTPMSEGTLYRVTIGKQVSATMQALTDGWVPIPVPKGECPADKISLEWGSPDESGVFPYTLNLYLDCDSGTDNAQARAKLNNLGYSVPAIDSLEAAVIQFQSDYGITERGLKSGKLPDGTKNRLDSIYKTNCDASTPQKQPT